MHITADTYAHCTLMKALMPQVSTAARLPWYSLRQCFTELSGASHCCCWHLTDTTQVLHIYVGIA